MYPLGSLFGLGFDTATEIGVLGISAAEGLSVWLVGAIEALGLIGDKFGLEGGLWIMADATGAHFGTLGYVVIAIFVATWLVAFVVYRATGYPKIPTLDHS